MRNILTEIVARKAAEIAELLSRMPKDAPRKSLVKAVQSKAPSLIAEIKPISPSSGRLVDRIKIPEIVYLYNRHAQAISVLCDRATFGGGYDLLAEVRGMTDLPILAKDFVVDERQIAAAADAGADSILLIACLLEPLQLGDFAVSATSLGLDILVELHDEADVRIADELLRSLDDTAKKHVLLGINNRDLRTQTINLGTTERLATMLKSIGLSEFPLISESGIGTANDIGRLSPHVRGFLIGTAILKTENPEAFLSTLLHSS